MALADADSSISVRNDITGKFIKNGEVLQMWAKNPVKFTVFYKVQNLGDKATGDMWVLGTLRRDGANLNPPAAVPLQSVNLGATGSWASLFFKQVQHGEPAEYGYTKFEAKLNADAFGNVQEVTEANNKAAFTFEVFAPPD